MNKRGETPSRYAKWPNVHTVHIPKSQQSISRPRPFALVDFLLLCNKVPTFNWTPGPNMLSVGSENLDLRIGRFIVSVPLAADLYTELDPAATLDENICRHHAVWQ